MATTQQPQSTPAPRARNIPRFTKSERIALADRHLALLADAQRAALSAVPSTTVPRMRSVGRWLRLQGVRLRELARGAWCALLSPEHVPGRLRAHLRLLSPRSVFNPWLALLVFGAAVTGVLTFASVIGTGSWWDEPLTKVSGGLFGGFVVAILTLFWHDVVRTPIVLWRMRRHIHRRPQRILLSNLGVRKVAVVPTADALQIVARSELYYDVLPGILSRDVKDVQIVVGDPGSGKTTALLGLAGVLARIGIVPVLVPLMTESNVDLVELAKKRFGEQAQGFARSDGEIDLLWRWLCRRRRVAILADDIDQIGPDGERGFAVRQALQEAAQHGLAVVVTARPAGVPAGVAASAIALGQLDEQTVVDGVIRGAKQNPDYEPSFAVPSQRLQDWIREGRLAETPFYLELLAQLAAAGECPKLADPSSLWSESPRPGRSRLRPDGRHEWNAQWVRFFLLDLYCQKMIEGRVRRWLGIGPHERRSCLHALQGAALGMLAATGAAARARQQRRADRDRHMPERMTIPDFISSDDRREQCPQGPQRVDARGKRASKQTDDVRQRREHRQRPGVSVHEVVDTGERLRVLDRDHEGTLKFRHRIMQAYLAGVCIAEREHQRISAKSARKAGASRCSEHPTIDDLLDPHHPEKLTVHMALTFAALIADEQRSALEAKRPPDESAAAAWGDVGRRIVRCLVKAGERSRDGEAWPLRGGAVDYGAGRFPTPAAGVPSVHVANGRKPHSPTTSTGFDLDPMRAVDDEQRVDADDALMKLTTAADVARAIECGSEDNEPSHATEKGVSQSKIVDEVGKTNFATRWTKLNAICALGALETEACWTAVWDFARDPDYMVRRAACETLAANAYRAYRALEEPIEELIVRAAARSAVGLDLARPEREPAAREHKEGRFDVRHWTEKDDIPRLRALGWVLPALVSGMREDPSAHAQQAWQGIDGEDADERAWPSRQRRIVGSSEGPSLRDYSIYARSARTALDRMVALAYSGGYHDLEASLAQGFKTDAMRHAEARVPQTGDGAGVAGPGWVANNCRLVGDIGLEQAEFWYARMVLYQALALYAIAGADADHALDRFARHLARGGREHHPFTRLAARYARAAILRGQLRTPRWQALIWPDETEVAGRRATMLENRVAQLVGDVTVLLDINEGSSEDCQQAFGYMRELPHCLHASGDRREVLGVGCAETCGWGLCPYKQPPPDEPNAHRGVSRAFCRQQRQIARRLRPPWQRAISRRALREFWWQMERRART